MKILLWDVDSKIPNLALMKLSAYHKELGDEIILKKGKDFGFENWMNIDKGYASVVFSWNINFVRKVKEKLNFPLEIGGITRPKVSLPPKIEHSMPDYDLYDCDFSIGFTSRGCIRKCEFCDVPKREGNIRKHSQIEEFHNPDHKKILLLDSNFLASPIRNDTIKYLFKNKLKVSICQGFDARLIKHSIAQELKELNNRCGIYDHNFKYRAIYTAWDRMEDEESVLMGIHHLLDVGFKPQYIRPYILVGYNTTLKEDLCRFKKLRNLGVYPFVMPYNNKSHPMKRWGQRSALYKSCSFENFRNIDISEKYCEMAKRRMSKCNRRLDEFCKIGED